MNTCLECNKETSNPKFCSLSCGSKLQARSRKLVDKRKVCAQCSSEFFYKVKHQKYCTSSCAATSNNMARAGYKYSFCIRCKINKVKNNVAKYCSVSCSGAAQTEKVISDWLTDHTTGNTPQGVKTAIKKYLIREAGHKCSKCGWNTINESTGHSPLEIDHIDGDSNNNSPSNLRVLCPNCHSLTSTYGALNKNSSRTYRRTTAAIS
jgi:HNH endonuclease